MSVEREISRKALEIYDRDLRPLAEKLSFELPVRAKEPPGLPNVLFLGNHSSGKSSFINHLLKSDTQKTGLAPTDDGFTILCHGEKVDQFDGQTVTSHPSLPLKNLNRLGPAFISRLRLKTVPNPLLKSFALVDSPGMIDAVGKADTREYDFASGVRFFAEKADLILFFFDPDKPGTTAETIRVLTHTLAGLEYKLLIILNKVDLFQNIRDFARTYGTLSWNLSKAIRTKDIPHIYNIYLPEHRTSVSEQGMPGIPLQDFDASRHEIIQELHRTPTRRADNVVSDLIHAGKRLSMHARLCHTIRLDYRKIQVKWMGISAGLLTLGTGAAWAAFQIWPGWEVITSVASSFALAALATWFWGQRLLKQFNLKLQDYETLDAFFADTFRHELALDDRTDLNAMWSGLKETVRNTFTVLHPGKVPNYFSMSRSIRKLETLLEQDIPKLRRAITSQDASPHS
ncbi:MAG: dynamin family protein [Verrucomicrobiota bacterium]|jgi:GTP-binding protein EngB required for normal cell division|nr:dynamin family protein [Verrucomicrobiota bacterium]